MLKTSVDLVRREFVLDSCFSFFIVEYWCNTTNGLVWYTPILHLILDTGSSPTILQDVHHDSCNATSLNAPQHSHHPPSYIGRCAEVGTWNRLPLKAEYFGRTGRVFDVLVPSSRQRRSRINNWIFGLGSSEDLSHTEGRSAPLGVKRILIGPSRVSGNPSRGGFGRYRNLDCRSSPW